MFKGISSERAKEETKNQSYKLVNVIQKYDIYEIKPCENNLEIDYFHFFWERRDSR